MKHKVTAVGTEFTEGTGLSWSHHDSRRRQCGEAQAAVRPSRTPTSPGQAAQPDQCKTTRAFRRYETRAGQSHRPVQAPSDTHAPGLILALQFTRPPRTKTGCSYTPSPPTPPHHGRFAHIWTKPSPLGTPEVPASRPHPSLPLKSSSLSFQKGPDRPSFGFASWTNQPPLI